MVLDPVWDSDSPPPGPQGECRTCRTARASVGPDPQPVIVTDRVSDFFLEVIPRKMRLFLILNLDLDERDDPTQQAFDATGWGAVHPRG